MPNEAKQQTIFDYQFDYFAHMNSSYVCLSMSFVAHFEKSMETR